MSHSHAGPRRRCSEWVNLRERNEALDLEVYALAALYIMGPAFVRGLRERAEALARPGATQEAAPAPAAVAARLPYWQRPRRLGGWVNGWRR